MKSYRYPQKLRPDVDFITWRRNLSCVTTLRILHRHVISRTTGEIIRITRQESLGCLFEKGSIYKSR